MRADNYLKCVHLNLKEGFGYYYVVNNSKTKMELETKFQNTNGVKLMKPYRIPSIKLKVLPSEEYIVPITLSPKGYTYKC